MKSSGKIILITLVLLMGSSSVMLAQRGMRGQMPDSARMGRSGYRMMYMRQMEMSSDSVRMHHGMWKPPMYRMHQGFGMCPCMAWGPGFRFRGGFGPAQFNKPGFAPIAPGLRRLETIPNLTEKQKKEIADLRQKQQDELQKFREETAAKVEDMREIHRKKVIDLLTDEQKKYLEGNTQTSPPVKK